MGRRSISGGVRAKGDDAIEFDFWYARKRYKPTLKITPTEKNLRDARKRMEAINRRIRAGTFKFSEEFPDYKFLHLVEDVVAAQTFRQVALSFLRSIQNENDFSTADNYRKMLGLQRWELEGREPTAAELKRRPTVGWWIPRFGDKPIADIGFSAIKSELGNHPFGKRKTRNNVVSVGRLVFDYAKADKIITASPMDDIKTLKVQREPPDPYTVGEAEKLIAGIREDWGDYDANYVEYLFFAGHRPSEAIALQWPDIDRVKGITRVDKARVMARDKETTKTSVARDVELNPRARSVLERQWELTGLAGRNVFGHDDGRPYHDLQVQWKRWKYTHKRLGIRYREPYQMRHTSVTWNLMVGKNLLWVAEMHGHSATVMLKTYAKWLKASTAEDIQAIRDAMEFVSNSSLKTENVHTYSRKMAEREGFEPS